MLRVVEGSTGQEVQSGLEHLGTLDELARKGARTMLELALQVEVEEYVAKHRDARGQDGRALVVRNGTGSRAG